MSDLRSVLLGSVFTILLLNIAAMLPYAAFTVVFSLLSFAVLGTFVYLAIRTKLRRRREHAAALHNLAL